MTATPRFPWSITDDEVPTRHRAPRQSARGILDMTTKALLEKIRVAGLLAINVDAVLDRSEDMAFAGDLDAYLSAVKSLHGEAVFYSVTALDEDDFVCESDNDDDDAQPIPRNLSDIRPRIGKFKSHIGMAGRFDLATCVGAIGLTFSVTTAWYDEFLKLRDEALGVLNSEIDSENARLEAEQEEQLQAALQKLDALSGDRVFVALPTQKAMRAYALDHIPELTELDDHDLKTAIADLRAKIQARASTRR